LIVRVGGLLITARQADCVSRLVAQLVAESNFDIAMQVVRICGLDPFDVWAAWGMAYLHCSMFAKARNVFEHCLRSDDVAEV
jgi:hypothetical protein